MDIIPDSSITTQDMFRSDEQFLLTYSDEEKQKHEIDSTNAKLIFTPEFIPFYPKIKEIFKLNDKETLLYGFIRFYMANSGGRFYFTNEQLSSILGCSSQLVSNYVKSLTKKGLIQKSSKVKAGGGTVRFITAIFVVNNSSSEYKPAYTVDISPLIPNKNKINKNISINTNTRKPHGDTLVNTLITQFVSLTGFQPTDRKPRFEAYNLVRKMKGFAKERGKPESEEKIQELIRMYFVWLSEQDWASNLQTMSTVRRKFEIFKTEI